MLYVLHIKYIVHLTKTWSCPVTIDLRWGIAWDLKRSRSRNLTSCSRDDVQPVTKTTYWAQDDVQPVTRTTYWAQDDDRQERTDDSPAYPSPSGQPACWTRSLSYSSGEWPPLDYLWIYYWSCMRSDQTLQRSLRLGWWIIYLLLIMHAHCAAAQWSDSTASRWIIHLYLFSRMRSDRTRRRSLRPGRLSPKDRRLLKMILAIFISFLVCYLPITLVKVGYIYIYMIASSCFTVRFTSTPWPCKDLGTVPCLTPLCTDVTCTAGIPWPLVAPALAV